MFEPLPEKLSYPELEHKVLKFWEENEIFEKTLETREGSKSFAFYEGPPTVNGNPGIHHMMARTIKDAICRYKTMTGHYVRRQAGWDTHGLPVEIQVQKELGLKDKTAVEEYGIDKFNAACKEFVYKNIDKSDGWRYLTSRMGYWVDLDSAYITCTQEYVESVWWALKQYFDKGLIYKGFKVVPQSPTIETPLSSHELAQTYRDVRDPNCYLKLPVTDSKKESLKGAYIIVWTTTPWTLFANVALACGEKIDYVLVRNKRKFKDFELDEKYILAESRLEVLDGEYEVIEKFKGTELVGTRYDQILPYVDIKQDEHPNALSIIPGDFVSTEDGSGIVHLAPAFGEDDYRMSREYNLPFVQPVTPNGHFTDDCGEFSGRAIKNFKYEDHTEEGSDKDIVIRLKELNKIYRSTNDYLHSYPHCWRTDNPIMYYARESWFIKSPEYKANMIELNKDIKWQPAEIGTGRFGNWLEEVKDWSLSRDRFWGTPLPIWVSEDGEDLFAIGSRAELAEGTYVFEDGRKVPVKDCGIEIDLHRPFVDNVIFEKDGKTYKRVHEVIDVWFDSGAMPFAQMHYPFENKELFEEIFPSDFIAEGIDQTRGWFYTLHNIASALFDKPAFKGIIVNELILDKKGIKMSKSKGNSVDPFEMMEKYGADAVRWYLFVNNPPWKATLFNPDDIARTVISDFMRSISNTYAFFALYANIDGFTGNEDIIPIDERPEIDRWILSKANTLVKDFRNYMEDFELTRAHRAIQQFTINELSNWYVRRNRRRFWKGEMDADKIAAYQTLKEVMLIITKVMAPTAPFFAETLFGKLRNDNDPISIHLADMPEVDETLIDSKLERRMDLAQRIVNIARSLREKERIKVRQPLQRILVPVLNDDDKEAIEAVASIIKDELNVKNVELLGEEANEIVKRSAKPNFKTLGRKFGKQTQQVANLIRGLDNDQILSLEHNSKIELDFEDSKIEVLIEDIEIQSEDIEGWSVDTHEGITVALDTQLTDELIKEGIAREFVNRIQNLRKTSGFEVTDRIEITVEDNEEFRSAIEAMSDYIMNETLAENISFASLEDASEVDINEKMLKVLIVKK